MENGAQALLMAAAVLIFVIALSVTLTALAQAKSTADVVLFYSDRATFQEKVAQADLLAYEQGTRIVYIDTVIATIKRYKRELFAVKVKNDEGIIELDIDYSLMPENKIKEDIENFIGSHINDTATYKESYCIVSVNGEVTRGEDGATIKENDNYKVYIVYEKIKEE